MDGFAAIGEVLKWLGGLAVTDEFALGARTMLAGVFAFAGVTKLRHPLLAASAAANFGLVRSATAPVGYAIGAAELATAALLLSIWSSSLVVAGCVLALLLSLGFLAVTTRALVRGERFACHCLSASSDEELTLATPLRAAGMAAAAFIGAVNALRDEVLAAQGTVLPALTFAACLAGVPMAAHLCYQAWSRHQRFMRETDWAWILLGPQRRIDTLKTARR